MGPGLRPYVKRDWPSWVYRAGALPEGGLDIVDSEQIDQHQFDRYRENGYRLTPLEALEALAAQQTEFATLAAEREYDKRKKLSPRAAAEVEAAEAAAGAQHLPTIEETPHGLRGEPVTSDRELRLEAELEALKAQIAQLAAPKKRGRKPKKAQAEN